MTGRGTLAARRRALRWTRLAERRLRGRRSGRHAQGHFLCIDGLTGPDLAAIDYGRLTADYYKVGWHPDFLAEDGEGRVGLERLAAQASPDKIILSHCSVEEAVGFGQELGLTLFQGWYLDSLLGSLRSPRFKLVANS